MMQNLIFATFFLIALVLVISFKRTSYVQETTPRIRGLGIESKIPDRREYDQDEDEAMTSPHIEYNYSDEDRVNVANDLQKALIPINVPPGADGTMNFGYNIFLGRTPEEQKLSIVGRKLFRYTGGLGRVSPFRKYKQFSGMTTTPYCESEKSTSIVFHTTASASLNLQLPSIFPSRAVDDRSSFSASNFYEDTAGFLNFSRDKVKAFGDTTILGNTKASIAAQVGFSAGYSFTYTSYGLQQLYSAQNCFSGVRTWSTEVRKEIKRLGELFNPDEDEDDNEDDDESEGEDDQGSSSEVEKFNSFKTKSQDAQILDFFSKFGTHGIKNASYGQKCEATIFFEGGVSTSLYAGAMAQTNIFDALTWWDNKDDEGDSDESSGNGMGTEVIGEINGFNYQITNRMCAGKIRRISSCAPFSAIQSWSLKNNPALLDWSYEPIWQMDIPDFEEKTKENMRSVETKLKLAALKCGDYNCGGHGACTSNLGKWYDVSKSIITTKELEESFNKDSVTFYQSFWDSAKCFCFDGFYGENCDRGYILNEEPYRSGDRVYSRCSGRTQVAENECQEAAHMLGATGGVEVVSKLDYTPGCMVSSDKSKIIFNKRNGLWSSTPMYISVCKKEYALLGNDYNNVKQELDNKDTQRRATTCAAGTEITLPNECCLAVAATTDFMKSDSDRSCKVTKTSTGTSHTFEFQPAEMVNSMVYPMGCSYDPDTRKVYFNENALGGSTGVSSNIQVCFDKIGIVQ